MILLCFAFLVSCALPKSQDSPEVVAVVAKAKQALNDTADCTYAKSIAKAFYSAKPEAIAESVVADCNVYLNRWRQFEYEQFEMTASSPRTLIYSRNMVDKTYQKMQNEMYGTSISIILEEREKAKSKK